MAASTGLCIPTAMHHKRLSVKDVVLFGVLGALTFAAKYVMSPLPNIEPVSLMVMVFAVTFGWRALYPIYTYVAMEFLFYGLGKWSVCYLYVWLILAVAAILLRTMTNPVGWAVLSGAFGLLFGTLCAVVDVFVGGFHYAVVQWVGGISFDLMHCAGNFAIALILFVPMRKLLNKLYHQ